jgi:NAD(P)-dependent dehydrogenase (short-subunit alcohol dehydrogenase family)
MRGRTTSGFKVAAGITEDSGRKQSGKVAVHKESNDISEPVAVVTGAGSGIGRATATRLLDRGYRVVLAGRRREALVETAGKHAGALCVPTDVREPHSVAALFQATTDAFGRVDLLFNNAGSFGPAGTVDEIDVDEWLDAVATNLTGTFLCARHAFRVMRYQDPAGGRIINNGSISAHSPRPGNAAYTATKHAITGLTKQLALDGRRYGIACGQIDIGNAATAMADRIVSGVPQADGSIRPEPTFDPSHAADAVLAMAELPLDTNIAFLTITATAMPWIGRG